MDTRNVNCVTVQTPAKINLILDVQGKRPDGYHELRSLVTPISLCDTVRIEPTGNGIDVRMQPAGLPSRAEVAGIEPQENLAMRAAEGFFGCHGLAAGCRILIRKRIPVGAGLGGGSADAAGVLLGLNALFKTPLSHERLALIAAGLGSDVPPLLWGGPVWMSGRGERVTPVSAKHDARWQPLWLVLLNPGFSIPTTDIYRRWIPSLTLAAQNYKKAESDLIAGNVHGLCGCLRNSLQKVAFAKYPALELLAGALREAGARGVLLAGSGGTVFGIAATRAEAVRVRRDAVARLDPVVWSRIAKTMPDGVMVAHGPLEARV